MSEKTNWPNADLRAAYYQAADGISGVQQQAIRRVNGTRDPQLNDLAAKLRAALCNLREHLDENYNWD